MATLKLYLDTRSKSKTGEYPVKIVIRNANTSCMVPVGVSIPKEQWDARNLKVVRNQGKDKLNLYIRDMFNKVESAMLNICGAYSQISASEIRERVMEVLYPKPKRDMNFMHMYDAYMETKKVESTRTGYLSTRKMLTRFAEKNGIDLERLNIDDIDRIMVKSLKMFLDEHLSTNSSNQYMMRVHAVINDAINDELISSDPFRNVKLKKEATRKKAVGLDALRAYYRRTLKRNNAVVRDYFFLSLFLRGINPADMYELKDSDIDRDRIVYIRKKTGKVVSVKIEPEVQEYINKYKGRNGMLLDLSARRKCVDSIRALFACGVNNIEGIDTFYAARHSWATLAINECGASFGDVEMGLSHSATKSVTMTYINYDMTRVDEVNRKVIDLIVSD